MTLTSSDLENAPNEFVVPTLVGIDTLYVFICQVFTKISLLVQRRPSWMDLAAVLDFPTVIKKHGCHGQIRVGFYV